MTVALTALSEPQRQSWLGLLDVAADFADGWCLVGGQMVHLLCVEREFTPVRPTDDGDVILDVRAHPHVLRDFTQALVHTGFAPAGESLEGHQHRWARDRASIDVLIPQGLGRAARRRGMTGGTTLAAPGAQQAINRSEIVTVQVDDTVGSVRRPSMVGALVLKAAAFSVPNDPRRTGISLTSPSWRRWLEGPTGSPSSSLPATGHIWRRCCLPWRSHDRSGHRFKEPTVGSKR
jgi:hypothetical protein